MATEPLILDVNVLIALAWPQHVHHTRAHAWFGRLEVPWATAPFTETAFLRLTTTPAVVGERVPMSRALATLAAIRATPGHRFLPDGSTLAAPTISLERVQTPKQVTDAQLVNLAASCGAALATLDRGIAELVVPADRHRVVLVP